MNLSIGAVSSIVRRLANGVGAALGLVLCTANACLADPPPSRMRVQLATEYFRGPSQDNVGEKTILDFLLFALERTSLAAVFTAEGAPGSCGSGPDSCVPDASVYVTVLEANDEARLFARLEIAHGQDQRRPRDLAGITVPVAKLSGGLAKLVEQITAVLNPSLAAPVLLDMTCLSGSTQAEQHFARELQSSIAIRLRRSDTFIPLRQSGQPDTCVTPTFKTWSQTKVESPVDPTNAWLRIEATAAGEGYTVSIMLWRASQEPPLALPPLVVRASDIVGGKAPDAVRKITSALQGLLGEQGLAVQTALAASPSERLENALAALHADPARYDAAFAYFDLALWDDDAFETAALEYGNALAKRLRYEPALDVLRRARDGRDSAALNLTLAKTLLRSGDTEQALQEFQRLDAKNLAPKEGLLGIAQTHFVSGDLSAAMKAAGEAMRRFPDAAEPVLLAAQIAEAQQRYAQAKELYQRGLALSDSDQIRANLAALNVRMATAVRGEGAERWRKQIELLSELLEFGPTVVAYFRRAYAYTELALFAGGDGHSGRNERAAIFRQAAEDYRSAAALLSKTSSPDPLDQYPWLMPNLIEVEIMAEDFHQAEQDAKAFFLATAKAQQTTTSIQGLRSITALLSAVAAILSSGSAEKEIYLSEVMSTGVSLRPLQWDFEPMRAFLKDFAADHPNFEHRRRAALDAIERFEQKN